jgi:predicted permease
MNGAEWKDAWRGLRSRRGAGVFVVVLLAVALAANAVMFSVADSLVFRRQPFAEPERILALSGRTKAPERIDLATSARLMRAWREQGDLLSAVGGSLNKTLFLRGDGPMEEVSTLDVTIGFFDVLGSRPRWGRAFVDGDERDPSAFAVILSEDLARRRFGSPDRAPGQTLDASAGKLVVVGVMDRSFAYPSAKCQIWRALDPTGPLMRNFGGVSAVVRVRSDVPMAEVDARVRERAARVGAAAGLSSYTINTRPLFSPVAADRRTFVLVLLGAALSLLLAACASAASVELAGAARRTHTSAIQLALGASRARLARVVAIEGAQIVAAAVVIASVVAWFAIAAIGDLLPASLGNATNNPIDLDARVVAVMVGLAALAWLAAAASPIVAAFRSTLMPLIKADDRGASASRRAVVLRRVLTASQVAVAVALVTCAVLFARTYRNLLDVEKGFDSADLFSMSWSMPSDYPFAALRTQAVSVLRQTPGVGAVTTSSPPPSTGDSPGPVAIEVDGGAPADPPVLFGRKWVDVDYFNVVRLPLRAGRLPQPGDAPTDVVVPALFARRFWGSDDPTGHTFRLRPNDAWYRVIGVVGDFRTSRTRMPQDGDRELYFYYIPPPPSAPATAAATPAGPPPIDTGGSWRILSLTVRTDGRVTRESLQAIARRIDPKVDVTVDSVDREYRAQVDDTRLAAEVVSIFGWVAFGVAMAGVYGVMAFIVATRTREIGIRVALGADGPAIRRFVLGSSLRMALLGGAAGIALALAGARWLQSQLFGVSATDWPTYLVVTLAATLAAVAATWLPARHAAAVDPALTLRSP